MYICNVKRKTNYQLKNKIMEKERDELDEVNFQIYRLQYEIKKYRERCEIIGIDPEPRTDEYLEKIWKLMKKRDELTKN